MWRLVFAASLVAASVALHLLHYAIFRDAHHIFIYLLGDIAFVPVSVLLVTLVLERLFESKQKDQRLHKLNMVLGAFFSEVGNPLLTLFAAFHRGNPSLTNILKAKVGWKQKDFIAARHDLLASRLSISADQCDLCLVRDFLVQKRVFLLALLENPNLLEHDRMTDMLWAIFHLSEELSARKDLEHLSVPDKQHLEGDIRRAYEQLILEWLDYMKYLSRDYPYLYSLAVRINPFDPDAAAEVRP